MKLTKMILTVIAAGMLFSTAASAVPIDGSVFFFGGASASSAGGTTTIDFSPPPAEMVIIGTGDYASTIGSATTFTTFSFTGMGLGATLSSPPVDPLWIFMSGGLTYEFRLESLTNAVVMNGVINLGGSGFANITGFDETPGTFSLQSSGNTAQFLFTASTTAQAAVPDGGATVALLGLALAGAAALRRKLTA